VAKKALISGTDATWGGEGKHPCQDRRESFCWETRIGLRARKKDATGDARKTVNGVYRERAKPARKKKYRGVVKRRKAETRF